MSDRDIFLIEVARRGRDSAPTPVDYTTMRADIAAVKARPNITSVMAIPDVAGSPVDGDVLVYDAADGEWRPGTVVGGLPLMRTGTGSVQLQDVTQIHTGAGVQLESGGTGIAVMRVHFDGTGSLGYAARSDHFHTNPAPIYRPIAPGGYLSSGTRTLDSTSVTLAAGVTYNVRAQVNLQMRGADPGPCRYRLAVSINGNARQSPGGDSGFWCVQGVPDKTTWAHSRTIVGTGTAIPVSASVMYDSGGGSYTDAGEVEITFTTNR